jgi:antitoxin PrlF
MSTTMTRKEQVTIPKPIRDLLGLKPGSAVDFKVTDEGQVLLIPAETKESASRFVLLRGVANGIPEIAKSRWQSTSTTAVFLASQVHATRLATYQDNGMS